MGGGGQIPTWYLRYGYPFEKWAPLIRLPLLSKQVYKLETFSLYNFVFCYFSSVFQSFAQGLFKMVLALQTNNC